MAARSRRRAPVVISVLTLATIATSCGGDPARGGSTTSPGPSTTAPENAILEFALHCDPLDDRACLLPWPNDAFTVPDPGTATGRRVAIDASSTPVSIGGVPVDVATVNLADGFSPASTILTFVPGIDLGRSGIASDAAVSLAADAPIVLLDTTTGQRLAHRAELDPLSTVPDDRVLLIHPVAPLPAGHHVIVALRSLRDSTGATIERTTAFHAAIDGTPEPLERARALREMLATLEAVGISDDDLFVAWEFTVASALVQPAGGATGGPAQPGMSYRDPIDARIAEQLALLAGGG